MFTILIRGTTIFRQTQSAGGILLADTNKKLNEGEVRAY